MKHKSIEFFDINEVDKSYNHKKFKDYLNLQKIKVYNQRKIVAFYLHRFVMHILIYQITLSHFKLLEKLKSYKE